MGFISFLQKSKYWLLFYLCCAKISLIRILTNRKDFVFFLSTPRHGNLGDHAIVFSQYKFFESIGYKHRIIEFNETLYEVCKTKIQKFVHSDDIIIIDGGGNIGTLWPKEEAVIRDIITRFHNNYIYIMPETAYFENSINGRKSLKESIEIYSAHPKLTVFCRDEISYKLFSDKFVKVESYYVPDMVMFISDIPVSNKRSGAVVCFRKDLEGIFSESAKEKIIKEIKKQNIKISHSSTVIDKRINSPKQRSPYLYNKWSEFSQAEFVITDRLHGMIFCAITGTPCLAIDNVSHKVRDGYKWLEHLPYIIYCENEADAFKKLTHLLKISSINFSYDTSAFEKYYDLMKKVFNDKK